VGEPPAATDQATISAAPAREATSTLKIRAPKERGADRAWWTGLESPPTASQVKQTTPLSEWIIRSWEKLWSQAAQVVVFMVFSLRGHSVK